MADHSQQNSPVNGNGKRRPWRLYVILFAVLGGGGLYVWEEHLEDHVIPKRWGVVHEGIIYRSGKLPTNLARWVFPKYRLKRVVAFDRAGKGPDTEAALCEDLEIQHTRLPLRGDGTGSIEHYAEAIALMHRAAQTGEPVLVHCTAGSQRTGGVVACYRLLIDGWSPDRVVEEMLKYDWKRDDVKVVNYVNKNMSQLVELLVEKQVIARPPESLPRLNS